METAKPLREYSIIALLYLPCCILCVMMKFIGFLYFIACMLMPLMKPPPRFARISLAQTAQICSGPPVISIVDIETWVVWRCFSGQGPI